MMTFIYGLIDPRNNELRYIGKSNHPQKRYEKHIREAKRSTILHRYAWIRSLLNIGLIPKLIILMQIPEKSWSNVERLLIASLNKSGYKLTNMAEGGLGGSTAKGRKRPKELSEKLSKINKERFANNDSLILQARQYALEAWQDEEFRKKRDIALNSPEVKAKMSKFQKQRWANKEIRQRQSEVGKRNWQNPELAKTMREKIILKWQDPEYRKRMSEAQKIRWARQKQQLVDARAI